ncbi:MAG: hypothetical protein GY929_13105 [Actinomycetia bacterium]|nr:hypothetical protein [Actinomycetes bacterium]
MTKRPGDNPTSDPVLARRAQIAGWVRLGKRIGYSLWGIAIVAYAVGLVDRYRPGLVTVIVTCLIVGSVFLLPAIILGYAVRAADREDREEGRLQ